ncbi:sulfite exporter TauE/SafE family protein [Allosaccharopolyspora coralli]|nr:sulfite exporter TauE/SafE family protein [Allosaccharopolyspora coralli]
MSPLVVFAIAAAAIFLGSVVQGSIGMGMNLVAAPLVTLVDPSYVPVPLLIPLAVLGTLTWAREHEHVHWRGVGYLSAGRIPGSLIGVAMVALLPAREFGIAIGVLVFCFVALSMTSWQPRPTTGSLVTAGVASGVAGTASSIGGPPVALLYQYAGGPRLRATLAAVSVLGTIVSLLFLFVGGQVTLSGVLAGVGLLPFTALGFAVSSPLRRFVDGARMRPAVLVVSAGSALVLVLRGMMA